MVAAAAAAAKFGNGHDDDDTELLSHLTLLFGCRTQLDVLYRDRLARYQAVGLRLLVGFSREASLPKTNVQDLIRQQAPKISWQDLSSCAGRGERGRGGGSVYVCGRLELLEGVTNALVDVASVAGGLDAKRTRLFVKGLKETGRLKSDCWSVVDSTAGGRIRYPMEVGNERSSS